MAETFRPPQGVRDEASRALKWLADGKAGSGFTDTGRKRASDLAAGKPVSLDVIFRMYSFFKRHEVDKKATGFNAGEDGFPSAGRVAWSAWGGDAGFTWASSIRDKMAARSAIIIGETMEKRDSATVPDLVEELRELLGTAVQFYFRAHGAHWNVKGADFSEYHKLFQKIYETAYELIDPIAENLRKIGSVAPFRLAEFMQLGYLQDATPGQDPMSLARDLLTANDIFLDELSDVFDCATAYGQQGIANFIAGAIDDQQFYKWQLTASLGEEVTQPSPDPVDAQGNDLDDMAEESMPMMDEAYPMMRAASGSMDLPIGSRDYAWSASDADKRVRDWANGDWNKYGQAFFYVNPDKKGQFGGYKLQFADIIGGTLTAIPRGIFAVAAVLNGSRGGVDIPAEDVAKIKAKVSDYYDKMATKFEDPSLVVPFEPRSMSHDLQERKSAIASAERLTFNAEVRSIATDDGSLRIGGYAAQFNKEATGLNFREMIAPGAFTRSLKSGDPVFLLVNHDTDQLPLASTQGGTLTLSEDNVGLRMEATLDPSNPRAAELASALTRGDVDKMSFAFSVAPGGDTREEGLRTLTDLNLFEVSVVTWPAYDASSVGMRSEDAADDDLELRKRKLALKFKLDSL
jgi:HK97 family phage prohead protease